MAALRGAQSCGEVVQHACRGPAVMRLLLLAGVETGGLWRGDLLSRLLLNGVNFWDQAVSSGIMAPNRQLEPLPWIST
jgi:hypothetical protein